MGILYIHQVELEIDVLRAEVKFHGQIMKLSSIKEYTVLALLASDPYVVRSIDLIKEHARFNTHGEVYTLISRLRNKFNDEIIVSHTQTRDRQTGYSLLWKGR